MSSLTCYDSIDKVIAGEFANVPAEADSDSGDSLFITQKAAPQAARSLRKRRFCPKDPEYPEEREEQYESEPVREKRRFKCNLPKYNFPFLAERKLKLRRTPFPDQNKSLLNYTIGGFFKCVGKLRRSNQSGKDPKSCLPTVDVDGEDICPLSEEDEDEPEAEDIKVVEKKCFMSKAKRQQTWYKATTVGPEASQGERNKLPAETSKSQVTPVTTVTESSDNDGTFVAQSEEQDTGLFLEDEPEDDSDATVCKLSRSTPVPETHAERGEGQHESVEEGPGQNEEEPDGLQRQEEGDIPVSKKKTREKSKSGQEVDGCFEPEVSKEKKSHRDESMYSSVKEPENDAVIQKKKKKKRKKEEGIVMPETCAEEEAANRTVDLPLLSKDKLEESVTCLETSDSTYVKKKKHKKKRQSSSNDAAADVSDHPEPSVKEKKVCEGLNSSNTNNKGDETNEGLDSSSAEPVTKKKKKRKTPKDKVAQSDDSVSVQEKEKRTSSFLAADAEENDGQAEKPAVSAGEEELSGVKKKKKKRKIAPDDIENHHQQSFEPETTDTEVKRKKKRAGSEAKNAADEGISPTREVVVMKKKKKKKHKDNPECEELVLEKGEPHDGSRASDRTSEGRLNTADQAAPGNHHYNRDEKRKSLMESAVLEPKKKKKKKKRKEEEEDRKKQSPVTCVVSETLSTSEMSSSDNMKNKHRKLKRRLYNPNEEFFSES